ncbi:MAG: ribose transport system substrate-binding protein [Thermoleophilaceae bacterium]|nr:ribose transport system substrate-binding protein [Thermoleophilaceae bacterium]
MSQVRVDGDGLKARRLRGMPIAALACSAALLFAVGCGGDDDSGSAGGNSGDKTAADGGGNDLLAQAAEDAAKAKQAESSFEPWNPGPAPKPQAGTEVGALTCLQSVPACSRIADGYKAAIDAIGWSGRVLDGTADQSKQRSAMQSFLTADVDGILLAAIDPHGIDDLLDRAKQRKIEWNMAAGIDPQPFGGVGESVDVTGGLKEAGRQLGAWVADDSKGEAKILVFNSSDNPGLAVREAGFREYLDQFEGISYVGDTINVPFAQVGPPLQAQMQSLLQRYPAGEIDYVFTPFDGFATFVVNAVTSAGRDDVKVLGFDGSPQNVDFIRNGEGQVATQATPWEWCTWLAVDNLNRAMQGEDVFDGGCPSQVLDKSNVPPKGELWMGNADYETEFRKLWGVG